VKKHTKIYINYFGYHLTDWMPCEICGCQGVDIHHIEARGMGGSNTKDEIDNLMLLCRGHHVKFGDKKQYKEMLKEVHFNFMQNNGK
jgi:5-methylcytosine-specific restriction endonuclease McrA